MGDDFDSVLEPLGGFGKFQIFSLLQISVIVTLAGVTDLGYIFTTSSLNHRCLIKECESEESQFMQPWLSSAIPSANGDFNLCERYRPQTSTDQCSNASFSNEIEGCNEFVFETEEWTVPREDWGIRCEFDRWKLSLIGSLNNVGAVLGTLFVGFLADRYGRKVVIVYMGTIVAILGIIKSFSSSYIMFATMEFIQTAVGGGMYALPFVMSVEIVGHTKRLIAGCLLTVAYPIGEMIPPAVQWLTQDWRLSLRIMYAPYLLIILFVWTLPESARWLHAQNRTEELLKVLEKIASMNRAILTQESIKKVFDRKTSNTEKVPDEKSDQIVIWKSKIMRKRYGAILLLWIVTLSTFFGLNLSAVSISKNKFLDSISVSLIEFPSLFLAIWSMGLSFMGRRFTLTSSMSLCAVSCLAFAYISEDAHISRLFVFLCGKLGITAALLSLNVFTTELFPTRVRSTVNSIGHFWGRIAAVLAPQAPLLMVYYRPIPLLIFFVLAAIGACVTLYLPETLGIKLPDTVAEAELLGRKKTMVNGNSTSTIASHVI